MLSLSVLREKKTNARLRFFVVQRLVSHLDCSRDRKTDRTTSGKKGRNAAGASVRSSPSPLVEPFSQRWVHGCSRVSPAILCSGPFSICTHRMSNSEIPQWKMESMIDIIKLFNIVEGFTIQEWCTNKYHHCPLVRVFHARRRRNARQPCLCIEVHTIPQTKWV